MKVLLRWLVNAVSLLIVARFVSGFVVRGFVDALIAALIIGLVNATLGTILKVLTFPLTILTLGFFLIVVNAAMLKLAARVTPGFEVHGWGAAILGAIVLAIVSSFLHWLVGDDRRERD
jgi:putative membrane protein